MNTSILKLLTLSSLLTYNSYATEIFCNSDQISQQKQSIFTLAQKFQGQSDESGEKQKALEALVDPLLKCTPSKSIEEKAQAALGAWQQVFGPYTEDGSGKVSKYFDTNHIYQMILPKGRYYNVTLFKIGKKRWIGYFRGEYSLGTDHLNVKFNKIGMVLFPPKDLKSLPEVAFRFEQKPKTLRSFSFNPGWLPGEQSGQLYELYADSEIRLLYGKIDGVNRNSLYVMKRVNNSF